jgi:hypothetical protein
LHYFVAKKDRGYTVPPSRSRTPKTAGKEERSADSGVTQDKERK